jgi:hypothetical protein
MKIFALLPGLAASVALVRDRPRKPLQRKHGFRQPKRTDPT